MTISEDKLAELERWAKKAQAICPEPWKQIESKYVVVDAAGGTVSISQALDVGDYFEHASPSTVLALVAEIRRLRTDAAPCANGEYGRSCGHDFSEHRDGRCQAGVEVNEGWATCGCVRFVPEMTMAEIRAHVEKHRDGSCGVRAHVCRVRTVGVRPGH